MEAPRRPRPSPKRQHPHRTTLRWSNVDYAELLAGAEREGVTVGAYIRARTLAAPTTRARRRPSVDVVAISRLLCAVNRMGVNLHIIAKHLNFGGFVEAGELRTALAGYEQMVAAIMTELGGRS